MTDRLDLEARFEALLEQRLNARSVAASRSFDPVAITQAAAQAGGRQDGRGLPRLEWPGTRLSSTRVTLVVVLFALLLAALAAIAVGANLLRLHERLPGAIYPTGPMVTLRTGAAVAVLGDGRVLIAGGQAEDQTQSAQPPTNVAGAELYDPATNRFIPTGQMVQPRSLATATALADGRVLITGGTLDAGGTPMSTAELFDPATQTFSLTGAMYEPRVQASAILLADGRVLVFGGSPTTSDGANPGLTSTEIYDPTTGKWSSGKPMPETRSSTGTIGSTWPTAVLLADGRVLIAGGSVNDTPLASALIWDPLTGSTSPTGSMTVARSDASATLLADGRVLIVGGNAATPASPRRVVALASAELFDPATGRFTATGSLNTEQFGHSATLLPDGRVLIAGGANAIGSPLSTEVFDPATATFSVGPMAAASHGTEAALLPAGRVLLEGDSPEVFDPALAAPVQPVGPSESPNRAFIKTGNPIQDRLAHTATPLLDGRVLIVGGRLPDGTVLSSAEIYDPKSGTFRATGSLKTARSSPSAVRLGDGRVLIVGGTPTAVVPGTPIQTFELYDPATGQFTEVGSIHPSGPAGVGFIEAIVLPTGDALVLAAGPYTGSSPDPASTQVYAFDGAKGTTTLIKTLPPCQPAAGDAVTTDGRVLLYCSAAIDGTVTLQFFDPASGRLSSPVPAAPGGTVVRLADGRFLIDDWRSTGTIAILDPAMNQLTPVDPLPTDFGPVTPSRLADGRVLFIGYASAMVWDPQTNLFRKTPPTLTSLGGETATLLADDRILIVGGTSWPADRGLPHPPSAELFDPTVTP